MKRQRKNVHIILIPGNHDFDYQFFLSQEENQCSMDEEEIKKWLEGKKEKYKLKSVDEEVIINEIFESKEISFKISLKNKVEISPRIIKHR